PAIRSTTTSMAVLSRGAEQTVSIYPVHSSEAVSQPSVIDPWSVDSRRPPQKDYCGRTAHLPDAADLRQRQIALPCLSLQDGGGTIVLGKKGEKDAPHDH